MKKISSIVEFQIPSYAHDDYPVFVSFIKAYFEWLEEEGNLAYFNENYQNNLDIDLADDDFVKEFLEEFVELLPTEKQIDDKTLVKYIREFYLSKGSEQSFRFIFRILFNNTIDIIYPREYIFKSSNGTWAGDVYLRTTAEKFKFLNLNDPDATISVVGKTSRSSAIVDTIELKFSENQEYIQLELSSYDNDFTIGEFVEISVNNQTIIETTIGGVVDLQITDGESDVDIGDVVTIDDINGKEFSASVSRISSGEFDSATINSAGTLYEVNDFVYAVPVLENVNGFGYVGRVTQVGAGGEIEAINVVNSGGLYYTETPARVVSAAGTGADITLTGSNIGTILDIKIDNSGLYYNSLSDLTVRVNGTIFSGITATLGCVFTAPKEWKDDKGFTSHNSRIIDSHYYQQFSYALKSTIQPQKWVGIIKRLAHPAGTEMFAIWENEANFFIGATNIENSIQYSLQLIGETVVFSDITTEDSAKQRGVVNDETCNATYNVSDLDFIKFADSFTWSVGYFDDLTINTLETRCQPDLKYTNDSQIDFEVV